MSRQWKTGSTTAHRRARALVLEANLRDNGGRCTLRKPGCLGRATQAHHVYGRALTGDDPRHMVAACAPCNQSVGDPMAGDPDPRPRSNW